MKARTLVLTSEDVEMLADVLATSEARYAIADVPGKENWCHDMLARLQEAE